MPQKITMLAENCWIIRSTRAGKVMYMEAPSIWNASPASATIFRDYDAAQSMLAEAKKLCGFGDELLDVVPLYGALMVLPRA